MHWPWTMNSPPMVTDGNRVAIVTPSWGGPASFPKRFEAGKRYLIEEFGLDVTVMPNACKPANWLEQNPQARADDVMQAFADPDISAVIASIGGDDAIRVNADPKPRLFAAVFPGTCSYD